MTHEGWIKAKDATELGRYVSPGALERYDLTHEGWFLWDEEELNWNPFIPRSCTMVFRVPIYRR